MRVPVAAASALVAAGGLLPGCGPHVDGTAAERSATSTTAGRAASAPPPRVAPRRRLVCKVRPGSTKLPASARRGLIGHLLQYPEVTLATPGQRARAKRLLRRLGSASRNQRWGDLRAAARAGYSTRTADRRAGDRSVHYFHAERRQEPRRSVILNPNRPKALIYANAPGRPLVLVGAMWSMRDDERGPNPGGPITRWHTHVVCGAPGRRGLKPPPSGKCPPGTKLMQGNSEMFHVWFTSDLRSAFAIRAPAPELCSAGLLPRRHCLRVARRPATEE